MLSHLLWGGTGGLWSEGGVPVHQVTLAEMSFVALLLIVVDDYDAPLYRVSLSENLVQASYRQKCFNAWGCLLLFTNL